METSKKVLIIGAGGHGRVIADALLAGINASELLKNQDRYEFLGFVDADTCIHGTALPGLGKVLGGDPQIDILINKHGLTHYILGVGMANAGGKLRIKLAALAESRGLQPAVVIHPTAIIAADVIIKPGTVVMAGAIINTGCRIDRHAIINTGAVLDHDCKISANAHIAPGVTMSGEVSVGVNSMVGVGSVVRQQINIGDNVMVGAGSVVVKNVADNDMVLGVPACSRKT